MGRTHSKIETRRQIVPTTDERTPLPWLTRSTTLDEMGNPAGRRAGPAAARAGRGRPNVVIPGGRSPAARAGAPRPVAGATNDSRIAGQRPAIGPIEGIGPAVDPTESGPVPTRSAAAPALKAASAARAAGGLLRAGLPGRASPSPVERIAAAGGTPGTGRTSSVTGRRRRGTAARHRTVTTHPASGGMRPVVRAQRAAIADRTPWNAPIGLRVAAGERSFADPRPEAGRRRDRPRTSSRVSPVVGDRRRAVPVRAENVLGSPVQVRPAGGRVMSGVRPSAVVRSVVLRIVRIGVPAESVAPTIAAMGAARRRTQRAPGRTTPVTSAVPTGRIVSVHRRSTRTSREMSSIG